MGARLLHRVREPAPRIRREILRPPGELAACGEAARRCPCPSWARGARAAPRSRRPPLIYGTGGGRGAAGVAPVTSVWANVARPKLKVAAQGPGRAELTPNVSFPLTRS